jgi:hypothetical protein
MSLSQDTMMELMAYADGELEGEALARTEALVQSSEEARRIVDAMTGLGDYVRQAGDEAVAARSDFAMADGIVDAVMHKLSSEPTAKLRRPTSIAAARQRRAGTVAAVVGLVALAAGAMMILRSNEQSKTEVALVGPARPAEIAPLETASRPGTLAAPGTSGALAQASPENSGTAPGAPAAPGSPTSGVDVEQVESPSHQVSVFYLPAVAAAATNSNASSVVVWIGDDNGGH